MTNGSFRPRESARKTSRIHRGRFVATSSLQRRVSRFVTFALKTHQQPITYVVRVCHERSNLSVFYFAQFFGPSFWSNLVVFHTNDILGRVSFVKKPTDVR